MSQIEQRPIRIAHIMGKMMSGGVEAMVLNYYRHIDRTQVQFDFIIDADSTIVPEEEICSLGGRVFRIAPYQKPFAYHRELVALFRREKWRIVHSHINTLSVFPLFAAKRAGVPIRIAHSHSTAGKGETARNIMKYALRPFAKLFPTHYCACSAYAGRWLFGDKLVDSGKVMLVRNAIDTSKFTFNARVREEMRKELGVEGKFVVGHVGRFMMQKNHNFLIDIFEQIHARNPNSVLLLIGEGELEESIRQQVQRLGLNKYVDFLGVRNDVHSILQAMDVFVLPSLYEGLPVVGVEAQASGLRMVASDTVTEEAKITDSFAFFSLQKSTAEWAEIAVQSSAISREDASRQVHERGYDIQEAAERLCGYYGFLYQAD